MCKSSQGFYGSNDGPDCTALAKPAAAPAAEIDYLLLELRAQAELQRVQGYGTGADALTRAAELLERLSPVPVPVAEGLPGPKPEDCDAEGRCWLQGKVEGDWRLINPAESGVPLRYCFSHWLPAHALPLPAPQDGEVQP